VKSLELPPQPEGRPVDVGGAAYHVIEVGSGPPTLFLHGGGPGSSGWTDFGAVAQLFARDRRCVIVDLLQYGQSTKTPVSGPMWSFHAGKLRDLLDALGFERADLVCNSWGGSMALCLAARHPERVRSVSVTGCVPVLDAPSELVVGMRRGRAGRDAYYGGEGPTSEKMRELMRELEWFDEALIPDSTVELRHRQSLNKEEMARAAHSDAERGDPEDLTEALGGIECPVLFAWGLHDPFVGPEYALMLARLVQRGQVHVFDRASHHPQEERPADYHRVVSAFLAGVADNDRKADA
jgi:pimeloyl-ACP methyl ester carboxylesterase